MGRFMDAGLVEREVFSVGKARQGMMMKISAWVLQLGVLERGIVCSGNLFRAQAVRFSPSRTFSRIVLALGLMLAGGLWPYAAANAGTHSPTANPVNGANIW